MQTGIVRFQPKNDIEFIKDSTTMIDLICILSKLQITLGVHEFMKGDNKLYIYWADEYES